MMNAHRFGLLVVLVVGSPALAQKISIGPFIGPGAGAVRNQVSAALCEAADCVSDAKIFKGPKPDWKKAKAEGVVSVMTGKVVVKGKKKTVELSIFKGAGPAKTRKVLPIEGGAVQDQALSDATAGLLRVMGAAVKSPAPPREEPAPDREPAKPVKEEPTPVRDTPIAEPTPEPKNDVPPPPPEAKQDEPAPSSNKIKPPVIAVQVSLDLLSRSFSYNNVKTMNLRSYSAGLILAPEPHIEFYPLALATDNFLSGLGLEASYQIAVGLKSKRSGSDVTYPTSMSRLDFGLRWRFRPVDSADAGITPFVGYRIQSFSVGKGSDGSQLDGLPGVTYGALRAGIAGDIPFGSTGLLAFADFAVLPVLSSGEIGSKTYFANTSNLGLDAQIGLGFKLPPLPNLQIRAAFDFTRYGLSFKTAATDTYQADSAADLYIGGEIGVRFTY